MSCAYARQSYQNGIVKNWLNSLLNYIINSFLVYLKKSYSLNELFFVSNQKLLKSSKLLIKFTEPISPLIRSVKFSKQIETCGEIPIRFIFVYSKISSFLRKTTTHCQRKYQNFNEIFKKQDGNRQTWFPSHVLAKSFCTLMFTRCVMQRNA